MKRTENQVLRLQQCCLGPPPAPTAQQPKMSVTSRQPQTQLQAATGKGGQQHRCSARHSVPGSERRSQRRVGPLSAAEQSALLGCPMWKDQDVVKSGQMFSHLYVLYVNVQHTISKTVLWTVAKE